MTTGNTNQALIFHYNNSRNKDEKFYQIKQLNIQLVKHFFTTLLYILASMYIFIQLRNNENNNNSKLSDINVDDYVWITSIFLYFFKSYLAFKTINCSIIDKYQEIYRKGSEFYENESFSIENLSFSLKNMKNKQQFIKFQSETFNVFSLAHMTCSLVYLVADTNTVKQNRIIYQLSLFTLLLIDITLQFNLFKTVIDDILLDIKKDINDCKFLIDSRDNNMNEIDQSDECKIRNVL